MSLSPYVCTQCGGPVDRKTLTCNHCGTTFYMDEQQVLVVREGRPGEHTINAIVSIEPHELMYDSERRLEYAVEELTHRLARELAPYLEIEQNADPRRGVYLLHAHCRVLEPHGPYTTTRTRCSLHPSRNCADDVLRKMYEERMKNEL